jgi:hypothetical protein
VSALLGKSSRLLLSIGIMAFSTYSNDIISVKGRFIEVVYAQEQLDDLTN